MRIQVIPKYSSVIGNIENDVVELSYNFQGSDPEDDSFYSLIFKRKDYEMGIDNLAKTNHCLIIGERGSIEIKLNDNKSFRIIIKTSSRTEILDDVDYKFYE